MPNEFKITKSKELYFVSMGDAYNILTQDRAECFHTFFQVEMASFMSLSQHRDTKAMFCLFYKITSVLRWKKTQFYSVNTSSVSLYSNKK